MESKDILTLEIKTNEKQFFTFSLRRYNEPSEIGTRNLSPGTNDRFALDFSKHFSIILEFWFLNRGNKNEITRISN